jgi:DNA-binding NtrC family response regulator
MKNIKVLLIEDDVVDQMAFKRIVSAGGLSFDYTIAGSVADARSVLSRETADVIVADYLLGDGTAFDILDMPLACPVIITTGAGDEEVAVRAMKAGAYDYLTKDPGHNYLKILPITIEKALKQMRTEERWRELSSRESEDAAIVGGAGLQETLRLIELAAYADSPVLITGETGTGKNLAAKAIHYRSHARNSPFLGINCAALPENLIETELFGYRKGAFTGAATDRKGIFELAEDGTLFLDEIGEMPPHLQSKLLSVIEEKQVRRVGGESARHVNVRVLAATSADLKKALGTTFRADLYYRLSVIRIHIPPLRERRSDIPELCSYLLKKITEGREIILSDSELAKLMSYEWPGNVRELRNILERALLLQSGTELRPSELLGETGGPVKTPDQEHTEHPLQTLEEVEQSHIKEALRRLSGNVTQTAKALDISLSTLKRKIKHYGLK